MTIPAHITTRDGLQLHVAHWPLAAGQHVQGVACLVHGLGEHIGRYAHVAQHLNKAGWAVVGYDHRGHGQSEGGRGRLQDDDDLLHDLARVIDTIRKGYPGVPLCVIGHSMGGLTVARFVSALASPPENAPWQRQVERCVLSSPALDIGMNALQKLLLNTVGRLTPDLAVGSGLNAQHVSRDAAVIKAYLADPLVHDRITGRLTRFMLEGGETVLARAAQWTVPTLLLYAGADTIVRPAGSAAFAQRAPAALVQAKAYAALAHEIFNEPEQAAVLNDLSTWLNRPLT